LDLIIVGDGNSYTESHGLQNSYKIVLDRNLPC
jgi:hypothetical protein